VGSFSEGFASAFAKEELNQSAELPESFDPVREAAMRVSEYVHSFSVEDCDLRVPPV
jgi:hypothetical protein